MKCWVDSFFLFKQPLGSICCKNVLHSDRDRREIFVGRHTDLSSHHHGPSISLIKAAPPTAAGGASSHGGSWTISACALCAHANRSPAQHNNRGGETQNRLKVKTVNWWLTLFQNCISYRKSPLLEFKPTSFFHPWPPSLGERLFGMFGIVALTPIGRSCMGMGRLSSLSLRSVSRSSVRGGCGGSALRTGSKVLG